MATTDSLAGALMTSYVMAVLLFSNFTQASWDCSCHRWDSYDKKTTSLATCPDNKLLNGFERKANSLGQYLSSLRCGICCDPPKRFSSIKDKIVMYADWGNDFDLTNNFNVCPKGFFLKGLYAPDLKNIKMGRCWKYATVPYEYEECYIQDIDIDKDLVNKCRKHYYITGLYKGDKGDKSSQFRSITKMKCCKMAKDIIQIESIHDARLRIMDQTLRPLVKLGKQLGYHNPNHGCKNPKLELDLEKGEGYALECAKGHKECWFFERLSECESGNNPYLPKIVYEDLKFIVQNITWHDEEILPDLEPNSIDKGEIANYLDRETTHTVTKEISNVETFRHTRSSASKLGLETSSSISYEGAFASAEASFTFGFSSEKESTKEQGKETERKIKLEKKIVIPPKSARAWTASSKRSKVINRYTARVRIHFSACFDGYLFTSNAHTSYRGRGSAKFKYCFGDKDTPFYEALRENMHKNSEPWVWASILGNYRDDMEYLKELKNPELYEFDVTGKVEMSGGKDFEVSVKSIPLESVGLPIGKRFSPEEEAPIQQGKDSVRLP